MLIISHILGIIFIPNLLLLMRKRKVPFMKINKYFYLLFSQLYFNIPIIFPSFPCSENGLHHGKPWEIIIYLE